MSGFEVVGVVLGVLPLVITAAQNYKQGFEPLAKWMRFRTDFIKFIDTVDYEMKMFNATLERFLLSVNVPEDELRKLMTDPEYEGWESEELGKALRGKLGTSYDVYMSTMDTMGELMMALQKLLSLKDGKVDWAKPGADKWDFQLKRLHASFRNKGPRTVDALEKLNRKLRDLLDVNDKLESMRATRKDTSWGTIFQSIRRHASSLHSAIRKSWNCGCDAPHVATLALQQRKTGDWSSKFNMAFDIVEKESESIKYREVVISLRKNVDEAEKELASVAIPNQAAERGQYLDTLRHDFKAMSTPQVNEIHRPVPISSQSDPSPMGMQLNAAMKTHAIDSLSKIFSGRKPKVKKSVRMNIPSPAAVPATPRSLSPIPPAATKEKEVDTTVEIKDLCATLKDTHSGCIGYIKDEKHCHELRDLPPHKNEIERDSYVTLETILGFTGETKVSRRQRYKIASILASSLLQLHSTPWVIDKIDKKNVLFQKVGSEVQVDSPFMRCTFWTVESSQKGPNEHNSCADARGAIKSGLRNLAIVVLELCFGEPIESHHSWKHHLGQDGRPHDGTAFMTAVDWLESVRDEEPDLELVVQRCLYGHFELKADWNNVKFIQAVYAGVVEPLEKLVSPR